MKLTKAVRFEMRDDIIKKIIDPQIVTIEDRIKVIAQETANGRYPKKILDWISNMPPGGLPLQNSVYVMLDKDTYFFHELLKERATEYRYRNKISYQLSKPIRVLAQDQHGDDLIVSKRHANELTKMREKLNAIQQQRTELNETILAALFACNTHKQLQDKYPELAQYLPKIEQQTKALAVTNDKVRAALCIK